MTYTDVLQQIKSYVDGHPQIAQWGYGYLSDITGKGTEQPTQTPEYPYFFMVPNPHRTEQNQIVYSFNFIMMDAVNLKDVPGQMPNYSKVQSECIQMVTDIMAMMTFDQGVHWTIKPTGTLTPFKERFDDWVAGATLTVEVVVPGGLNACDVPQNIGN